MKQQTVLMHPALVRYLAMKQSYDVSPLVLFAVRDGYLPNLETAQRAFDGVLQWLAAHAVDEHPKKPFVMMNGEVDLAFHAFLLNTRSYLHFCREFVGFFIHHTPIMDLATTEYDILGGIDYTLGYLQAAYGSQLSPALSNWVRLHEQGELTATSVSCVSNGPDRVAHEIIGVADFRTFWDTNPQHMVGTA